MKTAKGYKLFCMDTEGALHPLFCDKNNTYPIGEWIKAKEAYTKNFAPRPGLHCGKIPSAPWLMSVREDGAGFYKGRRKGWHRVWVEVEYNCTVDYNNEVAQLKKKCFDNRLPENGYYLFKEFGKATWIISDSIKITRILQENERQDILRAVGYDEAKEFIPYKNAIEKRKKVN